MSIQSKRLDRGWSQEDLALHSGVSARTIQRVENGKRASLETLKCLAAVFETSVSDLVTEQTMTDQNSNLSQFNKDLETEAIAYVQNLKAFHLNWITYVILVPCLTAVNLYLSPEFLWVILVAVFWALAIGLHALTMFGLFSVFGANWEQREFQKRIKLSRK